MKRESLVGSDQAQRSLFNWNNLEGIHTDFTQTLKDRFVDSNDLYNAVECL